MRSLDRKPVGSLPSRGAAAIAVPKLDGAFRPNDLLEQARLVADIVDVDTIVAAGGRLLIAAADRVLTLEAETGETELVARFDAPVSALAARGDMVAVGLASGPVHLLRGGATVRSITEAGGRKLTCPTALLLRANDVVIAEGSRQNGPAQWSRDLLERNASGRVIAVEIETGHVSILAGKAAFPNGLAEDEMGRLVVAQSWRHCLSPVTALSERNALLRTLPGYPSRMAPAADGGFWLALFGMRTPLLEFVLRDHAFRRTMLETVPPDFWIAPALQSRKSFLDPSQQDPEQQPDIAKPWSPPRSYGLVVKLDAAFRPQYSLHSRVGGHRHGVTAACELDGVVYVVSKGAGQVVAVDLASVKAL